MNTKYERQSLFFFSTGSAGMRRVFCISNASNLLRLARYGFNCLGRASHRQGSLISGGNAKEDYYSYDVSFIFPPFPQQTRVHFSAPSPVFNHARWISSRFLIYQASHSLCRTSDKTTLHPFNYQQTSVNMRYAIIFTSFAAAVAAQSGVAAPSGSSAPYVRSELQTIPLEMVVML